LKKDNEELGLEPWKKPKDTLRLLEDRCLMQQREHF